MSLRAFEAFKKEAKRLAEIYNLRDWSIKFEYKNMGSGGAQIWYDTADRIAIVTLDTSVSDDKNAIECARHEMCHLFTARLEIAAKDRFAIEREIMDEIERIARTMERLKVVRA